MYADAAAREGKRDPAGPDAELERGSVAGQLGEEVDDGIDRLRLEHLVGRIVVERCDVLAESRTLSEGASGAIDVALQAAAEDALQPLGDANQLVEIDAGLDALAVEQVHQVLGRDVPRRLRRVRAAAETADRRVEQRRPRLERGERVRVARVARV